MACEDACNRVELQHRSIIPVFDLSASNYTCNNAAKKVLVFTEEEAEAEKFSNVPKVMCQVDIKIRKKI